MMSSSTKRTTMNQKLWRQQEIDVLKQILKLPEKKDNNNQNMKDKNNKEKKKTKDKDTW